MIRVAIVGIVRGLVRIDIQLGAAASVLAVQHGLQDPPTCVNEPIADLVHGQLGLFGEPLLLVLGWVWVFLVLDQPVTQHDSDRLGKIAATALHDLGIGAMLRRGGRCVIGRD